MSDKLDVLTGVRSNRRRFIAQAGMAGVAGIAGLGALSMDQRAAHAFHENTDLEIANFALNLEYLEAEFYLRAAYGNGLSSNETGGVGDTGKVTGGSKVPFKSSLIRQFAEELALDERNHVNFLRSALGDAAVARPQINLSTSFTAAARAAKIIGQNQTFDPFASEDNFLLGSFIFEDVGVTAYKGAAPFIDSKDILAAAAGILAVEAYHAGAIRALLLGRGKSSLIEAANKISDLRDMADGPDDRDQGITRNGKTNGQANFVPADENSIAFSRNAEQVLNIVYLGGGGGGGFFPNGLNGKIR